MRRFLFALACCLLTAAAATTAATADPPNVLLILADDLGWSDLAVYGSDLHETPHLDRLAAQSIRFTNAYAASPVCSPTRASIMTGKTPARLKMTIWSEGALGDPPRRKLVHAHSKPDLPLAEVTIAELLYQAGYLTAHVGKWHLGEPGHYPEAQGFDINIAGTYWGAPLTFFFPYRGGGQFGEELRYVPGLHWGHTGEYLTDRLTDEALTVIDKAGSRPFFLNMWYHSVHTPIEGKPELVAHYEKKITPGLRHRNAQYAAMVHSLDENVGRLLARLDERGIADETLVIFASDNGGFVRKYDGRTVTDNYPLRAGKGSLYEGGVRVPLMIRWPGHTAAGAISHEMVSTIDFYPTLLEATGLTGDPDHNADVDGISLLPLLGGGPARLERDTLYFHYPHYYPTTTPVSAIHAGDWKLLYYYEDSHVELYNLADDPSEQHDVAAENPAVANRLRNRLMQRLHAVDAEFPTKAER